MTQTLGQYFQQEYAKISKTTITDAEARMTGIMGNLLDEVALARNNSVTLSDKLLSDLKGFASLVQSHPDAPPATLAEEKDTRTPEQKIADAASYAEMQKANAQRLQQAAEPPAPAEAPAAPAEPPAPAEAPAAPEAPPAPAETK